jgi:hypothetical protein
MDRTGILCVAWSTVRKTLTASTGVLVRQGTTVHPQIFRTII